MTMLRICSPAPPLRVEYQTLHVGWGPRRNHLYQGWCQSIQGFSILGGARTVVRATRLENGKPRFHCQGESLLQQFCTTMQTVIIVHNSLKIDSLSWLWASVGQQKCNVSAGYPRHHNHSFSSRSGTSFIAFWLLGPISITRRDSDDQRLRSLDDTFLLQSSPE